MHAEADAGDGRAATTSSDADPLRAQPAEQPPGRRPEVHRLLGRHAHAHPRAATARPAGRPREPLGRCRAASSPPRRLVGVGGVASLMPPPPPRAGTRRSRRRSGSCASSSSCVPRPTISPSSSTTIWSASMIVETRWRHDDHGGVARCAAAARRAAGRRSRGRAPRTSRRTGRSRACATSARAIASRWRWPPETLVPPWAIGASSPSGIASTKSRACATSSACHSSLVGGVRVAVAQVARDRAGEQVRPLRDQPDPAPQHVGVELAHVDAVDEHAAPPVTSNSRGIRETSVVLPAPVLPMIAVVWPGAAREARCPCSTGGSAPG